jgi:iron complex outermembrane recepter protein
MIKIKNMPKLSGFTRFICAVVLSFSLLPIANVRAQEPSPPPPTTGSNIPPAGAAASEATAERVIVTGSNIPTAEEVGPNPVDTYRRDDVTRLGVRTPTDLIQRIPAATGSNLGENVTNGGSGGATQVNLRGIDPKETLILQDGRRLSNDGQGAANFVDFNVFPLGLIDHIDILKDGASPVYGTDAVAGVVNVFLIHRFRGLELYASYGNTNLGFANDKGEETAYLLAGTGDDKTNIVVYAGIFNTASIQAADEPLAHDGNFNPFNGLDIRSSNMPGRIAGRFGTRYFIGVNGPSFTSLKTPTPHASANQYTDTQYIPGALVTPERQVFNFGDFASSVAATDREYLYGSMDRDLCDKYLTVFADFKYFRQFFDGQLAAAPFTPDLWVDQTHGLQISTQGISVPTQNAFNPFTVADYTSVGGFDPKVPINAASAAPAGTEFTTGVKFRGFRDIGRRDDKVTAENYEFTGGLKGNLGEFANAWDKLKTWEWEAGIRYNEDFRNEIFGPLTNNYNMRIALLDTNPATAFNPFGTGKNTKAVRDFVYTNVHHAGDASLLTEDLTIRGDIFDLPGGPISIAIGTVHETDHTFDNPDAIIVQNQALGFTGFQPTRGSRDSWSIFWEGRVPITGPSWNFPGAYSLEFDYAERFENYDDFGNTERPKLSVRWQPIDQSLTLRASYIEAFHAPALGELFSGVSQSFPATSDTATTANGINQVQQDFRGNRTLQPEIAYEYTYGGVLTPGKWWSPLQGLTLSVDFIHIDIRGFTAALDSGQAITLADAGKLPTFFDTPGPNTGTWVERSGTTGEILLVNTPLENLGRFITSAWDYEIVEIFETGRLGHGDWGTFTATFNGTYLADVDIQFIPNGKRTTIVGSYGGGFQGTNGFASFPHNRFYASLFYDGASGSWMQGIDGGVVVHYVGQYWDASGFEIFGATDTHGPLDRKIREWTTVDLILNYTFNLPPPAAQNEVAGYAKDGGKNVKMKDGKEKNVMPVSTAEYNPCGWRAWLNNTTLTLGVDNVGDLQPPFAAATAGSSDAQGYDESQANDKGRFWYVAVKKRF